MNSVFVIGRLGADPEKKSTQTGTSVLNFSVAVNERRGDVQEVHWLKVVAYGKTAENSEPLLKKGVEVFIQGKLWSRNWKTKEGVEKNTTEIVANIMRVSQPRNKTIPHEDLAHESAKQREEDVDAHERMTWA